MHDVGAPPDSIKTLKNIHWGNIVGVSCLAGNEYCVVSPVLVVLMCGTDMGYFCVVITCTSIYYRFYLLPGGVINYIHIIIMSCISVFPV